MIQAQGLLAQELGLSVRVIVDGFSPVFVNRFFPSSWSKSIRKASWEATSNATNRMLLYHVAGSGQAP